MKRRSVVGALCGGILSATAGWSRSRNAPSLSLGLIRAVNLSESALEVRIDIASEAGEPVDTVSRNLHEIGPDGNARADELVYRPDSSRSVSEYEYELAIDGRSILTLDGREIRDASADGFDDQSCLLVHFYVADAESDVSYRVKSLSTELSDDCTLPDRSSPVE